jgi:hypothetical protein
MRFIQRLTHPPLRTVHTLLLCLVHLVA